MICVADCHADPDQDQRFSFDKVLLAPQKPNLDMNHEPSSNKDMVFGRSSTSVCAATGNRQGIKPSETGPIWQVLEKKDYILWTEPFAGR